MKDIVVEDLETVPCALCGRDDYRPLFQIGEFPIVDCMGCGLRYLRRRLRPERLLEIYRQPDYFRSDNSMVQGYVDYFADRRNLLSTFRRRMGWLFKKLGHPRPGRLLDVGCAAGYGVEYAVSQGWDAYGLEPSPVAFHAAQERLGERVHCGTLDSAPYEGGFFDIILMWDVVEHLPDPLAILRKAHELLKPGGWLSVVTPDSGSVLARCMGRFWMEYAKPTEHIHFFSEATLNQAFLSTGFKPMVRTTAGKDVGLDFLVDRLVAVLKPLRFLKNVRGIGQGGSISIYVNPRDKMHFLARREP
jgi:2-polyprenyl-3-methyl-5-hydroxy-6-metoxy-1,4-benzoquinol methylase